LATLPNGQGCQVLELSPDGMTLAALDGGDQLTIWDMPPGKVRHSVHAHTERCWALAFHPRVNNLLATASWDGLIKFWDAASLQCRAVVPSTLKLDPTGKNPTHHNTIVFSPDGKWLAAGGYEGTVELWSVTAQQLQRHAFAAADYKTRFKVTKDVISRVTFSPDGQLLAVASWDKSVRLYQTGTWKLIATLSVNEPGYDERVLSLAFHPRGHLLAAGSLNGTIRLWTVPRLPKQGN
jgi:WD40 repeat protein